MRKEKGRKKIFFLITKNGDVAVLRTKKEEKRLLHVYERNTYEVVAAMRRTNGGGN